VKYQFLTADNPSEEGLFYIMLAMPKSVQFRQHFKGALFELTQPENWAFFGDITPDEAAELWSQILLTVRDVPMNEVGSFVYSIRETTPPNWIRCVGGDLAMAAWPELMEIYPSALKNQPSSGRFIVPNWAGRVMRGDGMADYGFNWSFLATGGSRTHTLTTNEMPTHAHTYVPPAPNIDLEDVGVPDIVAAGVGIPTNTGDAGGGQAHNNMQPYGVAKCFMVGRLLP
jgi:microcystin-dependent protein